MAILLDINIAPRLFARFNGSKFETLDMTGSPSSTTANHHSCYIIKKRQIVRHRVFFAFFVFLIETKV